MPKVNAYYLRTNRKTIIKPPVYCSGPKGRDQLRLPPDLGSNPVIIEAPGGRFEVFHNERFYIEDFVNEYGFKDKARAAENIKTMAEEISVNRDKFFAQILPRLAEIAIDQGRDLDDSFTYLAAVSRYYDVAGKNITPSYSPISKGVLRRDKYFLFEAVCENPNGFCNLFNFRLMNIASTFRYIAKYACRQLLFSMFELPKETQELSRITVRNAEVKEVEGEMQLVYEDEKVPEKRMGEMRRHIAGGLRQVESRVSARSDYEAMSAEDKANLLFREQIKFLRKYSHLGLVRIACVYLRDFIDLDLERSQNLKDEMFSAAKKNMQLVYDEMSNLSDVLFRYAYLVAERRTEVDYGKPLKEFNCPVTFDDAFSELAAADRTLRRQEDHVVRRGIAAVHKKKEERFARLHELILLHKSGFDKVRLAEEGDKRDDINLELAERIWDSLTDEERISLAGAFEKSKSKVAPAVGHANFLFGVYRYMRESRIAVLLSGANARKEFPSFDYDCFFLYEEEGVTTKGLANSQYFRALHRNLKDAIESMNHNFDNVFLPFPEGCGTLQALSAFFEKKDLKSYFNARAFSVLTFGAGERTFSAQAVDQIYGFVYSPEAAKIISGLRVLEYKDSRKPVFSTDEESEPLTNIKFHPGGLRDIAYLFWIYKLQNDNKEASVFKVLDQIKKECGEEVDQLIESYEFLMNIRIRLDLDIGRNNKDLPEGEELARFARSLGYRMSAAASPANEFSDDLLMHRARVSAISKKLIAKIVDLSYISSMVESRFGRVAVERILETLI